MNDFNTPKNGNDLGQELPARRLRPGPENEILGAIEVRLDSLPTRQTITVAHAIQRLAPSIKRLRLKGYSVDDVAQELTRELSALGLTVSGRTLARLLPHKAAAKVPHKTK